MLIDITSTESNIKFLNELSRELIRIAEDPKAIKELATEVDKKSKELFQRPKAVTPATTENPTETKT